MLFGICEPQNPPMPASWLTLRSFFIIMGIEVGVYLYGAGRAVIFQTAGDDGRGPWRSLAGAEKIGVPTSSGALC
jgi:hypothetical protein